MNKENTQSICIVCGCTKSKKIFKQLAGYEKGTYFDIYECLECTSRFILKDQIDYTIYDKIYIKQDSIEGYNRYRYYFNNIKQQKNKLEWLCNMEPILMIIKNYIKDQEKLKILEIGCGLGYTTYALNECGHDCTGIDISKEVIENAKNQFGEFFIEGDANNLGKSEQYQGKYDVVIATEVIEHIHDVYKFIDNITCYLKEGGVIILTTPNKDFIHNNYIRRGDKPTVHTSYISKTFFENYSSQKNMKLKVFNYIKHIKSINVLRYLMLQKIFLLMKSKEYYYRHQIDFSKNNKINESYIKKTYLKIINNKIFNKISYYLLNHIIYIPYSGLGVILEKNGKKI